ncbi:hypothetical protein [Afipia sp. Root123D2]|uniref:hypothetical protein n=1 Tax=Afipia sp. Root123D2 TaxID=1736436 RepID=UPI000ADA1999|nr:hypothetical protein [Afipia sp. Root123D2]
MHTNDNDQLGADTVIELRPSPEELNRILHRRFPGMGPAYGAQLDEAARMTFNADHSKWLGLDGRWHSTAEKYRQSKGSRRQTKATRANVNARHLDLPATGVFPERSQFRECGSEGEDYRRQRAMHWVEIMPLWTATPGPVERLDTGCAADVGFMGRAVHGNAAAGRAGCYGDPSAVENAMIALIDQTADQWAEIPAERAKRGRPRKMPVAANDNTPRQMRAA